jgi:glycosyltransferase involved in cell wall biosynthesis
MLSVSVIVPARDAASTLPRTLAALTSQDYPGEYEVIVVDDGSRDATAQAARAAGPPVIVVQQPQLGPAAARNRGAATARARRLAFCDADVFPGPGWLAAGVAALDRADLVQGRVQPDPEAARGPFDRTLWIDADVGLWETANLFVTRVAFERAGGFVEWIRPRRGKALAEDVWFFPAMAARMPELRTAFLHRRLFLNPRTAQLDAALVALAWATHRRRPGALLAALPYARSVRRAAVGRAADSAPPADPVVVAAADVAADLVGVAALLYGSLRYRAAVL